MADTKISALTAASAAALANEHAINEAGTSKKVTQQQILDAVDLLATAGAIADANKLLLIQSGVAKDIDMNALVAYIESRARVNNASVAAQGPGFSSDTYLVGSSCPIPAGRLQAKTMYRCKFNAVKTGAGTATPIINVRIGTAGTTSDTSRGTLTFSAQTGVIDEAVWEVNSIFRTVGSGTSAVLQSLGQLNHRLSITGFGTGVSEPEIATSGGFDSTVANLIIGLSVNGGTSASWTINVVQSEIWYLA
jgi:hypothetical protein